MQQATIHGAFAGRGSAGSYTVPAPTLSGGIPLVLFLVYLFLTVSRAHEFLFHIPRLMLLLGLMASVISFVTDPRLTVLQSPLVRLVLALGGCMVVGIPFSLWRGGSFAVVKDWVPYLLLFLVGCNTLKSEAALRKALYTAAAAIAFLLVMTQAFGATVMDRLTMASGTVSDPNDLAALLLMVLPCWIFVYLEANHKPVRKLVALVIIGGILFAVLRTGSRGGLVTMMALGFAVIWRVPRSSKLALSVLMLAVGPLMWALLPQSVTTRYTDFVSADTTWAADDMMARAAATSTAARTTLWKHGIVISLSHPILGVGPGQFVLANNKEYDEHGLRKPWQVNHSTYLQISSELGLPAFGMYLLLLVTCFRWTGTSRRSDPRYAWSELRSRAAFCVRLSLICFCVSSMFLSLAYLFHVPVLALLASGVRNSAGQEEASSGGQP